MGKFWIFGHAVRPQLDSQNTGRDPYMRPFGVATVSVAGLGGANNVRSLSPVAPVSKAPQYIATAAVAGSGSINGISTNPILEPLIDANGNTNIGISHMPQF